MPTLSLTPPAKLENLSFADLTKLVKTQAQQIKQTREELLKEFQQKLIQACAELGLRANKASEIAVKGGNGKQKVRAKGKRRFNPAPIRYRDNLGNEWSGLGHTPKWMRKHERTGHARTEFLVPGA